GKTGHGRDGRKGRVRVLYVEVDEGEVEVVCITRQGIDAGVDKYRYPRSGKPNVSAEIKILEFTPKYTNEEPPPPAHRKLWGRYDLNVLFPWTEYIVRLGWLPSGEAIWAQLLDRRQQHTVVIRIPVSLFMTYEEYFSSSASEPIHPSSSSASSSLLQIEILWEEKSEVWINVTDVLRFLEDDEGRGAGEKEEVNACDCKGAVRYPTTTTIRQITGGEWQVVDSEIWVDESRQLVYYMGKKDTPLESHLYVSSYSSSSTVPVSTESILKSGRRTEEDIVREQVLEERNVKRLTTLGKSHSVWMDKGCK
ncbi:dipeptidylpeptidase, partial [Rhizophlyctis rosea]